MNQSPTASETESGMPRPRTPWRPTRTAPSVRAAIHWRLGKLHGLPVRALARLEGSLAAGTVALTFDDGPTPYTAAVLDVLAGHGVLATFFAVGGNAHRNPRLIRRIVDEGHTLASHSLTHPDPWTLSPWALGRDYRDGRRAVEDVAGRSVPLFRPPKGHLGLRGAIAARRAGVTTWLWTRDAADWEPDLRPGDVPARLLPLASRDILLLHDGMERPLAPAAVDRSAMISGLTQLLERTAGSELKFVTLDHVRTATTTGPGTREATS